MILNELGKTCDNLDEQLNLKISKYRDWILTEIIFKEIAVLGGLFGQCLEVI